MSNDPLGIPQFNDKPPKIQPSQGGEVSKIPPDNKSVEPAQVSFTSELNKYITKEAEKYYPKTGIGETSKQINPLEANVFLKIEQNKAKTDLTALQGTSISPKANLYTGLKLGSKGKNVLEIQQNLNKWNPKLKLRTSGFYDEKTAQALTLFKAVNGTGIDGRSIDERTANLLTGLKDKSYWNFNPKNPENYRPERSIGGEVLYNAGSDLGIPYLLGGDGNTATDCGMFTKKALINSKMIDPKFKIDQSSRLADIQYFYAENGKFNLSLVKEPKPGDLIFFKNTSSQANIAYKKITHVGIYVGENLMIAASPGHGKVTLQKISEIGKEYIAGFGRLKPKKTT